ncbi:uncharacterized protein PHALS_15374 [Plasmopara halstedii]|uniref:Uncharacterized protein n=1 Tax=Plasmopara halstedii TaxID=4781 RepID=A0A0P1ATY2_PLAHL|nr:uncharacterized protein PHALS_15374 [Plasmopara halstedii]CEG44521.1 hypothetical protein PHALS_15374 [Plasmopara halstedii]|eukprot:XP_024580890.1 hypothetical protein PHALS_15374 [Plasmopara halstedii]
MYSSAVIWSFTSSFMAETCLFEYVLCIYNGKTHDEHFVTSSNMVDLIVLMILLTRARYMLPLMPNWVRYKTYTYNSLLN